MASLRIATPSTKAAKATRANSRRTTVDLKFEREEGPHPRGVVDTVSSAHVSANYGVKHAGGNGVKPLTIALIGPHEGRRSAVAAALDGTRQASVREFDSYPPELEH